MDPVISLLHFPWPKSLRGPTPPTPASGEPRTLHVEGGELAPCCSGNTQAPGVGSSWAVSSPESHQPPCYTSFVFAPISPPQRSPPWPVSLPLFFPTIYNKINFTLLTIFRSTFRGYHVYLYCCVSPLSISRPLSSSQTETLCLLSNNSSFHPTIPGNHPSTFYLYERDYSTNLK